MSSENIKKVYILNLDKTRILILASMGVLCLGAAFFAGTRINHSTETVEKDQPVTFSASVETSAQPKENGVMNLPPEDHKLFTAENQKNEDPFLLEPPEKNTITSKPDSKTAGSVEKSRKETVKKHSPVQKAENSAKTRSASSHDKTYYTIQLGAFAHEKDARASEKDLKKKGVDARVEKGTLYYFVRVGKSSSKDGLDAEYEKITNKLNLKAIIVQKKLS